MIINYEFYTSKSLKISIITSIAESFFNSYSILSRNFIFNPLSNFVGLFRINIKEKKFKNHTLYIFFILIFVFFITSLILVSKERGEFVTEKTDSTHKVLTKKKNESNYENYNSVINYFSRISKIIISRLIGIEGIMAVSSSQSLSLELFYDAVNEKFVRGEGSFYDKFKNVDRTQEDCKQKNFNKNNCTINSITLMGIIAFLYYSGSYLILIIGLMLICILCSVIEIVSYKISNNMIFCSLIAQILAYRLWHFGYLPSNSHKLLLSIGFMIFLIYLYKKLISIIQT